MYIFLVKIKNLIVSWYYDTILRYDTAGKKTILPSIPILKTLGMTFSINLLHGPVQKGYL
jgi:hypothetical protein